MCVNLQEDGVPSGIRTRVAAVKGRCPRPLDDGDEAQRAAAFRGCGRRNQASPDPTKTEPAAEAASSICSRTLSRPP